MGSIVLEKGPAGIDRGSENNPLGTEWVRKWDDMLWFDSGATLSGTESYGTFGLGLLTNGSGVTANTIAGGADSPGVVAIGSGSTAASRVAIATSPDAFNLASNENQLRFGARIKVNNIPTASDDHLLGMMLTDDWTNFGNTCAGVGIRRSTDDTNFVGIANDGGAGESTKISSTAFDTAWHNLEMVLDGANQEIKYYIDGTLFGTETSVWPNATTMGWQILTRQVAGSSALNDNIEIDLMWFHYKSKNARGSYLAWS